MKKILSTILAAGMVLGLSGLAMALTVSGDNTADVSATVNGYAEITGLDDISFDVDYNGTAYVGSGSDQFAVEANCSTTIATELTGALKTEFGADVDATLNITGNPSAGTVNPIVTVAVDSTSAISAHAAGAYGGLLTITVSN